MRFLRCDPDRAIVCVTGAHSDTADCLHCGIGNCNRIRTQCQRLDEICRFSEASGNHQGDTLGIGIVEMLSGPCKGRDRRDGYIVTEDDRRGAGSSATAIENDIVNAYFKCCINVFFNMLR